MRAQKRLQVAAFRVLALMCGRELVSTIFRKASWPLSWRPTQMMRAVGGKSLATSRAYMAGSNLRIAKSPLPPNRTRSKSVRAISEYRRKSKRAGAGKADRECQSVAATKNAYQ